MRQLVRSWMNLHTKTSCCCWGQNVSLPLVLFVFLQPCQRSASLEQLPFQSVPASCSLILQLCFLCTFRHYSFSPGSEPCKLRESPSTHTYTNPWKPKLPDFNIRSVQWERGSGRTGFPLFSSQWEGKMSWFTLLALTPRIWWWCSRKQ